MRIPGLRTRRALIGLILIVATLIGRTLAARQPPNAPSAVIENLNARIDAWWAMVALIGLAFIFGETGVIIAMM